MASRPLIRSRRLGLALLLGGSILVVGIAWAVELRSREDRALDAAGQAALAAVVSELDGRMEVPIDALVRFGAHWEGSEGAARERWNAEARFLLDDFPSFQALEWVDPELTVRWVLPLQGNEAALGLDLGFEARRREALEAARDQMTVVATHPIDLVQGGKGFLVYVPLLVAGRFDGFALGVYRLKVALGQILENLAPGFTIRVRDGDELLYARGEVPSGRWGESVGRVDVRNLAWRIEITPEPELVSAYRTRMPEQNIVGAVFYAAALVLLLHLAATRRDRAAELLEANERLRQAERAERGARVELAAILEDFPDHIWSGRWDPERGFEPVYHSPVIGQISGYKPEHFWKQPEHWLEVVDADDRERVRSTYESVLVGRQDAAACDYRIRRADGEERWIQDRIRTVRTEGERRAYGVISDVTDVRRAEAERRRLEIHMQQTQKLESLGLLAGGLAHDFNNLLVVSLGHANLALDSLPEDAAARTHIARIASSAERAAELCRQLLDYAGRADVKYARIDLLELTEDLGELLSTAKSKKVALRYEFAPDLPSVEANPTQLRQVLLNLITNASEAIGDERGEIRVSAAAREYDREALDALQLGHRLEAGRYVSLTVSDDGCGMDPETYSHMFEPFFSTKFTGRGLGLAAVLGIVRDHGGALGVESAPAQGTTITLVLPALALPAEPLQAAPETPGPWAGSGTVLVIDDEKDICELAAMVLGAVGFDTLTAGDGEQGVEIFRKHAQEIVCVLLDLTMPRLDGLETHRMLRALSVDVPVILCSGYSERETIERFDELGLTDFLQKPYRPRELIACIRGALAGSSAAS